MTAHRLPRRRALTGAVAMALATTCVVGIGITAAFTDAAYSDYANVNIGEGTDGNAIGVKQNFDIALMDRAGVMVTGSPHAASLAIPPAIAGDLAPGRTIQTTVTVFNNTPRWDAGVNVTLSSTGSAVLLSQMRFTAVDIATGAVIFGDAADPTRGVEIADASASLARRLAGLGRVPLMPGGAAAGVPAASRAEVKLIVTYLDTHNRELTDGLNGTTLPLTISFTAEKV